MGMLLVHELHEARDRILLLIQKLESAYDEELPAYRASLQNEIASLKNALEEARIPDRYRVAVVGRFKVGKSSFVNKLAQEALAGVETSPETAAISVFRYGDEAKAEVEFVSREEWDDLASMYQETPDHAEVKRYAGFARFNDRPVSKDRDGKDKPRPDVALDALATQWIREGGYTHTLHAQSWRTREDKKKFRAAVRKFTSSQEPLHYLVNKLTIYAPIPILRDHIELVDTPGLDDTEHFRVQLTEQLVREVDAILFLTLSGASYSQSDKDFLIRQLRRRQIRHLQIVVTKGDETFENAVRDARDNDDPVPTFEEFRASEVARVRGEISKTLDELLRSNQLSEDEGYYYMEQLDAVPVHLISTKFHDEAQLELGGIEGVRDALYQSLSTSHRFERSRQILTDRLGACLDRLKDRYTERISAIGSDYDPHKVKAQIESIRSALGEHLSFLAVEADELVEGLAQRQAAFAALLPTHLENIAFRAKEVLDTHEKTDLVKHWRTRRAGYWGYLVDLQARIADHIFPTVELKLNELLRQFEDFIVQLGHRLEAFQERVRRVEESHELTGLEPMALAAAQRPVFDQVTQGFSGITEAERNGIVNRLDEFVTGEVSERLMEARANVADVAGVGTTRRQAGEVRAYYDDVRQLLSDALETHLTVRFREFAEAILVNARSIAPTLRSGTLAMIEQRINAIESTLAIATADEKERVTAYLERMRAVVVNFAGDPMAIQGVANVQGTLRRGSVTALPHSSGIEEAGHGALVPRSYEIRDGEIGHTYESICRPYMDTATAIVVEDPYIRLPHQVDNFARFCALAVRVGQVREIELLTGRAFGEDTDDADSRLESLRKDLQSRGVVLNVRRDEKLHDRELRFNNGWRISIGRGLDVYYPPDGRVSLEFQDFSLRRCRQTKINVFRERSA